ncbi:MAG: hypothetical protein AAB355_00270 [Patescibacteria group bacterium]
MTHRAEGLNDIFEHNVIVRENLFTDGGTVEKVPVNSSDMANKAYVDSMISYPIILELIRNNAPTESNSSTTQNYFTLESSSSVNFNGRPTLFLFSASCRTTDADDVVGFGINIDGGANTDIVDHEIPVAGDHFPVSSFITLTPSAGDHVINIVWKRGGAVGTASMTTSDHIHLTAIQL